jgi:hypothetical protein
MIWSITTAHLHEVKSIGLLDEVATMTRAMDIAIVNTILYVGDYIPPDHPQVARAASQRGKLLGSKCSQNQFDVLTIESDRCVRAFHAQYFIYVGDFMTNNSFETDSV